MSSIIAGDVRPHIEKPLGYRDVNIMYANPSGPIADHDTQYGSHSSIL